MTDQNEKPSALVPIEVRSLDPVIVQMFKRIPSRGPWPLAQRSEWVQAMYGIFDMIYGPSDRVSVSVPGALDISRKSSSAEPTDEAMARDVVAASGSRAVAAETTEAPAKPGMGSERSSSAEAHPAEEREDAYNAAARVRAERARAERSNEKTPSEPDPPKLPALKDVGGAPSKSGRPADMPPNLACAIEALKELGGRAAAPQIRNFVRDKYWPKMPDHWSAVLYQFVTDGTLARDGINFTLPAPKKEVARRPAAPLPAKVAPKAAPKLQGVLFEHNGIKVELPSMRAYVVASKLKAAMGKGYVDPAFLAGSIIGSNTENHRDDIILCATSMQVALQAAGLKVEHHKGYGLVMKEIDA